MGLNQEIYDVLEPWLPAISDVVKQNRNREGFAKYYPDEPEREPELNWVFFRKYSPDDERNSLQHHHDTNMNTVNIALNDDYEGGDSSTSGRWRPLGRSTRNSRIKKNMATSGSTLSRRRIPPRSSSLICARGMWCFTITPW